MYKLNTAIKGLAQVLEDACPTQQLKSVTRARDQVALAVADADDRKVLINLLFLDPDEYPRSGVLVQVDEEASNCSSKVAQKLGALSERFQDGAQLFAVISKVRHCTASDLHRRLSLHLFPPHALGCKCTCVHVAARCGNVSKGFHAACTLWLACRCVLCWTYLSRRKCYGQPRRRQQEQAQAARALTLPWTRMPQSM